jgi:hypothetical protein
LNIEGSHLVNGETLTTFGRDAAKEQKKFTCIASCGDAALNLGEPITRRTCAMPVTVAVTKCQVSLHDGAAS